MSADAKDTPVADDGFDWASSRPLIAPRRHVSLATKLEVALRQLGLDPAAVRLDHSLPLALRQRTPDGGYIPAENDPRYMQFLSIEAHAVKTSGAAPGQGKATVANSDQHKIAKVRRLIAATAGNPRKTKPFPPGRPIPSRPFPTRRKK